MNYTARAVASPASRYLQAGGSAWRLALGDVDGWLKIAAGDDFHDRQLVKVMRDDAGSLLILEAVAQP